MILNSEKIAALWKQFAGTDLASGEQTFMNQAAFVEAVESAERYLCTQLTRIVRAKNRKEKRATSRKR